MNVKSGLKIISLLAYFCHAALSHADTGEATGYVNFHREVISDYRTFYSVQVLETQAFCLSLDAVMANTDFDPLIQKHWQADVRNGSTDDFFQAINRAADLTQYATAIPIYSIMMLIPNEAVATFGNRCLRSLLLGGPPQALLSSALGSGRPTTGQHDWAPFRYHRAVSGHAFYGALPLLNLAHQVQSPVLKGVFFTASFLPGLARINNDSHYTSQVFFGWWLAYSATQVVWRCKTVCPQKGHATWQIYPTFNGIGLEVRKNF